MALFNACEYLLDRRVAAGDGPRVALAGPAGEVTYGDLLDRVCRTARGLREIGVRPEQRILMVMADSPHFVVVYLAAMRVGAIPVPVSTMLRADGIAELLRIRGRRSSPSPTSLPPRWSRPSRRRQSWPAY